MKLGLAFVLILSVLGAVASTALLHQHPIANDIQISYQHHILAAELPAGLSQDLEVRIQGQDVFVSGTARTRSGNQGAAQQQIAAFLRQMPVNKIIGGPSPAVDRVHFAKDTFLVVPENRPWVAMHASGDNILVDGVVADEITRSRIARAAILKNPIATLSNRISIDPTATLNIDLDPTLTGIPITPTHDPRILYTAAWLGEAWHSWDHHLPEAELRAALREFFSEAQKLDEFLFVKPFSIPKPPPANRESKKSPVP